MFDINGGELIIIVVLAVLLIGPERLPAYAAQLGALVRRGKGMLQDAKSRVDTELGDEFRDVDWSKLDPRQYDPRRIVREALMDDDPDPSRAADAAGAASATTGAAAGAAAGAAGAGTGSPTPVPAGAPVPFDDEAT